jgi:hypothetical protein
VYPRKHEVKSTAAADMNSAPEAIEPQRRVVSEEQAISKQYIASIIKAVVLVYCWDTLKS